MLLKKIHHLKTKFKSHIDNVELIDVIFEDNATIRKEIEQLKKDIEIKEEKINLLNKKVFALEKLNISYSKDVMLLAQAIAEQYEIIGSILGQDYLFEYESYFDLKDQEKKKKKKVVH